MSSATFEKQEEERSRREGTPAKAAATVYTVRHEQTGAKRHFVVGEDGGVKQVADYKEGFGPMLLEPHPTAGFTHNGQFVRTHRYSLCWAPFELYHPKTADQLAGQRATRERNKAERAEKKWQEDNPLLAWAD